MQSAKLAKDLRKIKESKKQQQQQQQEQQQQKDTENKKEEHALVSSTSVDLNVDAAQMQNDTTTGTMTTTTTTNMSVEPVVEKMDELNISISSEKNNDTVTESSSSSSNIVPAVDGTSGSNEKTAKLASDINKKNENVVIFQQVSGDDVIQVFEITCSDAIAILTNNDEEFGIQWIDDVVVYGDIRLRMLHDILESNGDEPVVLNLGVPQDEENEDDEDEEEDFFNEFGDDVEEDDDFLNGEDDDEETEETENHQQVSAVPTNIAPASPATSNAKVGATSTTTTTSSPSIRATATASTISASTSAIASTPASPAKMMQSAIVSTDVTFTLIDVANDEVIDKLVIPKDRIVDFCTKNVGNPEPMPFFKQTLDDSVSAVTWYISARVREYVLDDVTNGAKQMTIGLRNTKSKANASSASASTSSAIASPSPSATSKSKLAKQPVKMTDEELQLAFLVDAATMKIPCLQRLCHVYCNCNFEAFEAAYNQILDNGSNNESNVRGTANIKKKFSQPQQLTTIEHFYFHLAAHINRASQSPLMGMDVSILDACFQIGSESFAASNNMEEALAYVRSYTNEIINMMPDENEVYAVAIPFISALPMSMSAKEVNYLLKQMSSKDGVPYPKAIELIAKAQSKDPSPSSRLLMEPILSEQAFMKRIELCCNSSNEAVEVLQKALISIGLIVGSSKKNSRKSICACTVEEIVTFGNVERLPSCSMSLLPFVLRSMGYRNVEKPVGRLDYTVLNLAVHIPAITNNSNNTTPTPTSTSTSIANSPSPSNASSINRNRMATSTTSSNTLSNSNNNNNSNSNSNSNSNNMATSSPAASVRSNVSNASTRRSLAQSF